MGHSVDDWTAAIADIRPVALNDSSRQSSLSVDSDNSAVERVSHRRTLPRRWYRPSGSQFGFQKVGYAGSGSTVFDWLSHLDRDETLQKVI